ncbi:MAG TPA: SMI1/KNR4 family protein [Polyangiaceae bacterium LLY-WYZ-15_(1-7)]|nr:SMI1/KNR4 family protein [Polyangiaceae bacterium LLY-WYZ-15_(1-7)]
MHRGVREFIRWVEAHRDDAEIQLNPPATTSDIAALEQMLGGPIPADLRFVLTRFNGGVLPAGELLPAGIEPGTIGHTVREYAEAVGGDFLDTELLLPFHKTPEGSLLAFDRSAGPVSDTWPVVDYYQDLDEHRLMYRTFDGWCRVCVAEWTSDDFGADFTLETYLRSGQRHAEVEPDVATAHATVAHALKRSGRPADSLAAYLQAARCVPPLPWCDWEALKIAAILDDEASAREAATRLASYAPAAHWAQRETSPGRVAEVLGPIVRRSGDPKPLLRLLEQLKAQADEEEGPVVEAILEALHAGKDLPPVRPLREQSVVPHVPDVDAWWEASQAAYAEGRLRDDDLLLDPDMVRLGRLRPFAELLHIRRGF